MQVLYLDIADPKSPDHVARRYLENGMGTTYEGRDQSNRATRFFSDLDEAKEERRSRKLRR